MQHTTSPFVIPVTDTLLSDHPHLKHLSRGLALKYAHNEWVTEAELQHMGAQLWQALEIDTHYQQHCATKGRRICPIIISSQHAAIQQLALDKLIQSGRFKLI